MRRIARAAGAGIGINDIHCSVAGSSRAASSTASTARSRNDTGTSGEVGQCNATTLLRAS
jgi:hypothetical protein